MQRQLNLKMPPTLYDELRNKSKETGVPIAVIVRRLVKKYLKGEVSI